MGIAICCRLLLRRLQQLGQTSRWHVHIALLPKAISVEYRLPPLHVHRSTRRNRQADVSSLQYPPRSIRVSISATVEPRTESRPEWQRRNFSSNSRYKGKEDSRGPPSPPLDKLHSSIPERAAKSNTLDNTSIEVRWRRNTRQRGVFRAIYKITYLPPPFQTFVRYFVPKTIAAAIMSGR